MSKFEQTEVNRVVRVSKRGHYDKETIYSILDEGYLCHAGFEIDGRPFVIPTLYARVEDSVFIHGSSVSRMLKRLDEGVETCITVTLVDGIVLARSAFHHSMNYRSAVVFGKGRRVVNDEEKLSALKAISENVLKHRWDDSRQPTENELNVTTVIEIPVNSASAKIRSGDPIDDENDYDLPIWAGVLPVKTRFGNAIPDSKLQAGIGLPDYLKDPLGE